jgi:hypothetical protein
VALALRPIVGGVALDFTSPRQQQVPELREQLREAALFVEMYSKAPDRWIDDPSQGRLPPLDISVNDVGAGARVLIRAERARDLPELLELARTLDILWQRSDCNEDLRVRGRIPLPSVRA